MQSSLVSDMHFAANSGSRDMGTLRVRFRRNNAIVEYYNVPRSVYAEVFNADSIGSTLTRLVIKGGYSFEYVDSTSA